MPTLLKKQQTFCRNCKNLNTASFGKLLDRNSIFILTAFFFFSGFAALIYEIIWTRIFADILGSTAIAMALVISAFLLLLALGAYLFDKYSLYSASALVLYGWKEIGIGISALIISALLFYMRSHYIFPASASQIYPVSLMYQFIITFLIMSIPTLLMGGTFPVILSVSSL